MATFQRCVKRSATEQYIYIQAVVAKSTVQVQATVLNNYAKIKSIANYVENVTKPESVQQAARVITCLSEMQHEQTIIFMIFHCLHFFNR